MADVQSGAFSVSGKTAIVTGAGSGINLAFASILLDRGCNVVFADLSLRPEAQKLVDANQDRALFVQTDVASWAALKHMFSATLDKFGDFDLVCPGAGVYEPLWSNFWHPPGSSESKDAVDSDRYALIDINLTHPIRTTQMAISYWLHPEKQAGSPKKVSAENPKRIVHISSVAGQMPNLNAPMYGASKFAITGFVRCLAGLDALHGIKVNAVAPGLVQTPLWMEHPEKLQFVNQGQDGWVTAEEVGQAMLRCAEDATVPGGAIVEVGKSHTRLVSVLNDSGPNVNPEGGMLAGYAEAKGRTEISAWLDDEAIWSSRG